MRAAFRMVHCTPVQVPDRLPWRQNKDASRAVDGLIQARKNAARQKPAIRGSAAGEALPQQRSGGVDILICAMTYRLSTL